MCSAPATHLRAVSCWALRCSMNKTEGIMRHSRVLFRLLLLITPFLPVAGQAEDVSNPDENSTMPRCGPQMDGQVYCKFGIIYECELIAPNSMERRTGWRWKADLLRACSAQTPAETGPQNALPPEFTYAPNQSEYPDARRHQSGTAGTSARQPGTMYIRP